MSNTIEIKAWFIRYGDIIINSTSIAEVRVGKGEVLMQSGHTYEIPSAVLEHAFSDLVDFSNVEICNDRRPSDML